MPLRHFPIMLAVLAAGAGAQSAEFTRVYPLRPDEGVFAYARISPDGNHLVYASQAFDTNRRVTRSPENLYGPKGGVTQQTVTVVDLRSKKILFTDPGIDGFWSPDGQRVIYSGRGVSMWHMSTGSVTNSVAPEGLGDYYSWGTRGGKDLILTITSNYYYLDGDRAVSPTGRVSTCPAIGRGDRPLLSHNGMQITTFVRGTIVVRNLTDCENVFDTGIQGAKADWSWDNRYIAFHVPKSGGVGYEIKVVDVKERTIRAVTNLPGSSLFPSWTRDGRLCFRYDGEDYRGFLMAANVLRAPAQPLAAAGDYVPIQRGWMQIFPETRRPGHELNLVMVWSTWSAHSPGALRDLQQTRDYFTSRRADVGVAMATEPASRPDDVHRMLNDERISLQRLPLNPTRLSLTEAQNQIPVTLLFRGDRLIDRRLGAQTFAELVAWVETAQRKKATE